MPNVMNKSKVFVAFACLSFLSAPATARQARHGEQDAAFEATRQGAVQSLRSIENNIVPQMKARGANYIGQEFDGDQNRYRLKFIRGKSVIWVDVDGRSGAIIGKAGD
jgi:hypothetical protein